MNFKYNKYKRSNKKISIVLFILIVVFLLNSLIVTSKSCKIGEENCEAPASISADLCKDCEYDSETATLKITSGSNPDISSYEGNVDIAEGGSFTYNGKKYSGPGKCEIRSGGVKCNLQQGSSIEGVNVLGDIEISSTGAITIRNGYYDGLSNGPGSTFIVEGNEIIITHGSVLFDSSFRGVIKTEDDGRAISPTGEEFIAKNGFEVLGNEVYILSPLTSVIKRVEGAETAYQLTTGIEGQYTYKKNECTANERTPNCIALVTNNAGENILDAFFTDGVALFYYTKEMFSLNSVNVAFGAEAATNSGINIRQFSLLQNGTKILEGGLFFDPVNGITILGGSYPSTITKGALVTYLDGREPQQEYLMPVLDDNGDIVNIDCGSCIFQSSGRATSFLGKAWAWITGKQQYLPANVLCNSHGIMERYNDDAGRARVFKPGLKFVEGVQVFEGTDSQGKKFYYQVLQLQSPLNIDGTPSGLQPQIVYAVNDPTDSRYGSQNTVTFYVVLSEGMQPFSQEAVNSVLANALEVNRKLYLIEKKQELSAIIQSLKVSGAYIDENGDIIRDPEKVNAKLNEKIKELNNINSELLKLPSLPRGVSVMQQIIASQYILDRTKFKGSERRWQCLNNCNTKCQTEHKCCGVDCVNICCYGIE